MEPKKIGGVEIYAPIKIQKETPQSDGTTLYEITVDNGSKDGIRVEYKEQEGKRVDGQNLPPVIYFDEKSKELSLRNLDSATIFGSELDDKIKSSCTNSIFNFKNGGKDVINQRPFNENNAPYNKLLIDSNDLYQEEILFNYKEPGDIMRERIIYKGTDDNKSELEIEEGTIVFFDD